MNKRDTLTAEERARIAARVAELLAHAPPLSEDQVRFVRTLGRTLSTTRTAAA